MPDIEKQVIAKGSKSFYLASLFFSSHVREGAWKLYRWCRYCDDQIDEAPTREIALTRLAELYRYTSIALGAEAITTSESVVLPAEFLALQQICQKYAIPSQYPLDLLRGFEMDVQGKVFSTLSEVEEYGYHVAGVVGLMMTHIFGASSPRALKHAVDMGVAMQLTNISRDILEDYAMERIYLPRKWLQEHNVPVETFGSKGAEDSVLQMAYRLLDRADQLYKSGYEGIRYLPTHAALAVSIAGLIYSSIGVKVRRQKHLRRRVYVTLPEKLFLTVVGTLRIIPLLVIRAVKPWKPHQSLELWPKNLETP